jgi:predicted Zn-dependent protease
MNRLETELNPARGYFELGLFEDAWAELDKLEPKATAHPETLLLRLDILLALERWEEAVSVGIGCCQKWRNYDSFFMKTATALISFGDWYHSYGLLKNAPETLLKSPEYHYTLARCASRQGLLTNAKEALAECFKLDKSYRKRFLDDEDLERVWDAI